MLRLHHSWSARCIAAAGAVALLLASVIGAYGHAAAHGDHGVHQAHHGDAGDQGAEATLLDLALQHTHGEESPGSGHDHGMCLDMACHGGVAILGDTCGVAVPDSETYVLEPAHFLRSTAPACLDRPPRSSFHA